MFDLCTFCRGCVCDTCKRNDGNCCDLHGRLCWERGDCPDYEPEETEDVDVMAEQIGSRIAGGNTAYKRVESDFYPTPPEATQALLGFLKLPAGAHIWEPACGKGHMVAVMRENGYCVTATDILTGDDFLTASLPEGIEWIITNPPFSLSEQFIEKCVELQRPFALLLKSQYWHAARRYKLFQRATPSYILPLTWRPDFLFKQRGGGSPLMDVIWVVWLLQQVDALNTTRYMPLQRPMKANGGDDDA